jgi:hypothetical protein
MRPVVEERDHHESEGRDQMEVVDERQVAESVEIGQALDEVGVELDPAGHTDRGRRLDRHASVVTYGVRMTRSAGK